MALADELGETLIAEEKIEIARRGKNYLFGGEMKFSEDLGFGIIARRIILVAGTLTFFIEKSDCVAA